jgi:leucyl aminopeptidase
VLYASDDMLAEAITRGGEAVHDPVWRLPFWKRYKRMLDSKVADTLNAAETAHAGSITAALFLKRFVSKAKRYAHSDVYMWRDDKQPGQPAGAELQAARAVDAALRRLIESKALNG